MIIGIRSSMSSCFLHKLIGCCLDFAAYAAAFGKYLHSGSAQKHLSPGAMQIFPVALQLSHQNNMHAAGSSGFFRSTGHHVFAGGASPPFEFMVFKTKVPFTY